jgi:vacuolar-type H+-ATPase subunit H
MQHVPKPSVCLIIDVLFFFLSSPGKRELNTDIFNTHGVLRDILPYNAWWKEEEMERKEILDTLKTTEVQIRAKIGSAQKKGNEILEHARKQIKKMEEEQEKNMIAEQEKILAEAKKEIDVERHTVLQKARADADQLKTKAQVTKATELFIKRFEEYLHV